MAARTLTLRVVSPEGVVVETEAEAVTVPSEAGSFGVLPRHAPLVALTDSGLLKASGGEGGDREYLIHDGFVEVLDDTVTILTRAAELPTEIDLERAARAAERARERLRKGGLRDLDYARAQAALRRALARERMARRHA